MSGSLIGGIVGAGLGYVTGGFSTAIGWTIGAFAGGLLDPGKLPDQYGPRISDLNPQSSEYGKPIPIIYGGVAVAGNVIWATPIVEVATTTESGGKGGSTQSSTAYSYFGNFAVLLGEGEYELSKIWSGPDKRLIYDGGALEGGQIRFYSGSGTQLPDPLIEAKLGAGRVPSYRGYCYIVFENFPLEKDGNRLPFITAEIGKSGGSFSRELLSEVVKDLSLRSGLGSSEIDASELTDIVDGYILARPTTVRAAIETLRPTYYFDGVESFAKVKYVKRGGAIDCTIPDADLAARPEGQVGPDPLVTVRQMEQELPNVVTVNYLVRAALYDPAAKIARRLIGHSREEVSLELPFVLSDTKAQQVAEVNLHVPWVQRLMYTFNLSKKYSQLEPSDIVVVQGHVMRITKISEAANRTLAIEAVADDGATYTPNVATTETPTLDQSVYITPSTRLEIL